MKFEFRPAEDMQESTGSIDLKPALETFGMLRDWMARKACIVEYLLHTSHIRIRSSEPIYVCTEYLHMEAGQGLLVAFVA